MSANLLWINVPEGETEAIPEGFVIASCLPQGEGTTFTVANSLPGNIGDILKTSPAFSTIFTFPVCPFPGGWKQHSVTAIGGNVIVGYANGN
jgi:hypothetical protein